MDHRLSLQLQGLAYSTFNAFTALARLRKASQGGELEAIRAGASVDEVGGVDPDLFIDRAPVFRSSGSSLFTEHIRSDTERLLGTRTPQSVHTNTA